MKPEVLSDVLRSLFVVDDTRLRDSVRKGLSLLPNNGRYVAIDGTNVLVHPALGICGKEKSSHG